MQYTENNLVPFTWEEAQRRPDAVVTRDGRPVKLAGYNPEARCSSEVLTGWAEGWGCHWTLKGEHAPSVCTKSGADLFLKPEAREVFQNVYPNRAMSFTFDSLQHAINHKNALDNTCYATPVAVLRLTYIGNEVKADIVHNYNIPGHE